MSKTTYYIVQTAPSVFARDNGELGHGTTRSAEDATRFTLPEANSIYRTACANTTEEAARRFPRIIKITTETKTIKERR